MKTGKSLIEVECARVIAALQPSMTKLKLNVLHRDERAMIASGKSWRGVDDLFAITPIDMDWLQRHCGRLVERYSQNAWWWFGGAEPSDPRKYLEHVFGTDPEGMSGQWSIDDAPWPDLNIRQPYATMPYRREWSGLDAWLMLRPELPQSSDEKWLIRAVDRGPVSMLTFIRSWTGFPVYALTLSKIGDKVATDCATVSLNERQRSFGTPEQERELLDWVIDSFLLRRRSDGVPTFEGDVSRSKRAWEASQHAGGLPEPLWSAARRATPRRGSAEEGYAKTSPHPDWTNYGDEDVPVGPKLGAYPLHTAEWRAAFLERLAQVGAAALLEATGRVWTLLVRPKAARATAIGIAAGVGGKGKKAIYNVLQAFLQDYLAMLDPPEIAAPGDIDAVHAAFTAAWANEAEREQQVLKKYAALLGGETAELVDAAPTSAIIKGPWLAARSAPAGMANLEEGRHSDR